MLDLVARESATASVPSPCTRRSARAWRGTGHRCCPGRRPRSPAPGRPCRVVVPPHAWSGARRRSTASTPRSRKRVDDLLRSTASPLASRRPGERPTAEPHASARLAMTEPGRPSPSRAALNALEPRDRLEQPARRAGQVRPTRPQAHEADGQQEHGELGVSPRPWTRSPNVRERRCATVSASPIAPAG